MFQVSEVEHGKLTTNLGSRKVDDPDAFNMYEGKMVARRVAFYLRFLKT
ncbi:MAG: hypothetical protein IPJ40_24365 [Saprospirales bacterium]|nr:hypothetical protein [Saprospirales bacterium]